MKTFTMIARHGVSKDNITAYTLISSDYQTTTMKAKELADALKANKITVVNLELGPKGIVSTNGAIDKYTLVSTETGMIEGTARAVILNRVEANGKLLGYTVFTHNGTLAELSVADASALANKGLISNGKIRHTEAGDIVSAIGGNYPLREITIDKAPKGEINADVLFYATALGTSSEYFGAIVSCTSAAEMSKLTDILNKSNAKVIADAVKLGGQSVRESLTVKRMGANSLYGVFELSVLEKLSSAKAKVNNKLDNITVSAVQYKKDETLEAVIKLSKQFKIVEASGSDSDELNKRAKEYAKRVISVLQK